MERIRRLTERAYTVNDKTLLTKLEAAKRLRICVRTLDRYRRVYKMGDVLLRGVVRFDPDILDSIVKSGGLTLRTLKSRVQCKPKL